MRLEHNYWKVQAYMGRKYLNLTLIVISVMNWIAVDSELMPLGSPWLRKYDITEIPSIFSKCKSFFSKIWNHVEINVGLFIHHKNFVRLSMVLSEKESVIVRMNHKLSPLEFLFSIPAQVARFLVASFTISDWVVWKPVANYFNMDIF